jgi:hypothetical protein
MQLKPFFAFVAFGLFAFDFGAHASEVDLSTLVNANLNTYTNGFLYPTNGGPLTVGGVAFNLAALPGGGTGIIQLGGDNNPSDTSPIPYFPSVTIPINQTGITTVYTLINSAFGTPTNPLTVIGSLDFLGSSGSYVYNLTEGDNVRDHFNGGFENSAPGLAASAYFGDGSVRLDEQAIVLPTGLGKLESITFSANDQYYGNGEPFLAGLTTSNVSAVPEPSTWTMMILAFGGLGLMAYRRKAKPAFCFA